MLLPTKRILETTPTINTQPLDLEQKVLMLNIMTELEGLRETQSLTTSECALFNQLAREVKAVGCQKNGNGWWMLPKGEKQ